jgi:hypothetical protein
MVEPLRHGVTGQREEECTHHWRIASPDGETSTGVCQLCGASREFQNYAYRSAMSRFRKPAAGEQPSA